MQNRRQTRKEKITDSPKGRKVREKFAEEKKLPPIVAKTEKQKQYLGMLNTLDAIGSIYYNTVRYQYCD